MRMFPLLVALLFSCAIVEAGPVKVYKLDAGYYLIQGDQIVAAQIVGPSDPVVPPPVIVPDSDLKKQIVAAVNQIPATDARHTAALKLSAVYQALAGKVRDGTIPPGSAVTAVDLLGKAALGTADAKTFAPVIAVVDAALSKATTATAIAGILTEAADAVASTVPASGDESMGALATRYGFDWDKFLEFIMQLLQVLLPLIIS